MHQAWTNKISNSAQLGGIETSVLDNGPGRGNRIAWLSHGGITSPASSGKGLDWLSSFGGGLFTTCGLSHVGGPEADKFGERGLHGRISNLKAELESIIQPDSV